MVIQRCDKLVLTELLVCCASLWRPKTFFFTLSKFLDQKF